MKKNVFAALIITVVMLAQVQPTFAQSPKIAQSEPINKSSDSWTLLGTKTIDYTLDRDVVSLTESKDSFKSLKFIVKNGALNMTKCTVHFTNGETKVIDFPSDSNSSTNGRVMELTGNKNSIEKVTFWYDSKNNGDKSVVELWGK